jgi:hypothetical protein
VRREFDGGLLHEPADFPVAGVITESHGGTVFFPDATVGGKDEHFLAAHERGIPAHASIQSSAKRSPEVAIQKHFGHW